MRRAARGENRRPPSGRRRSGGPTADCRSSFSSASRTTAPTPTGSSGGSARCLLASRSPPRTPAARSSWSITPKATNASHCSPLARRTVAPSSSDRNCSIKEVLPIPAGPVRRTVCGRPAPTSARTRRSAASSTARPTNGSSSSATATSHHRRSPTRHRARQPARQIVVREDAPRGWSPTHRWLTNHRPRCLQTLDGPAARPLTPGQRSRRPESLLERSKSRSWDCYRREGTPGKSTFLGMAESPFACGDHRRRNRRSVPRSRSAGARHRGGCVRAGPRARGDRRRHRAVRQFDPRVRPARAGGRAGGRLHRSHRAHLPALAGREPGRGVPGERRTTGTRSGSARRTSAFTAPTCRRPSVGRSARSTCTSAAGWSTSSRSATRSCSSSRTAVSNAPTWSSGRTGCVRQSGGSSTGADDAVYSGTSAFRGIVPVENLPSLPDPHAIQFWMGPDAHMLHYAIGGNGESVNFFAVVETPKIWLHPGCDRRRPRGPACRILPRLAPGDHRDDPRGREPDLVGAVHRASRCCVGTATAW